MSAVVTVTACAVALVLRWTVTVTAPLSAAAGYTSWLNLKPVVDVSSSTMVNVARFVLPSVAPPVGARQDQLHALVALRERVVDDADGDVRLRMPGPKLSVPPGAVQSVPTVAVFDAALHVTPTVPALPPVRVTVIVEVAAASLTA